MTWLLRLVCVSMFGAAVLFAGCGASSAQTFPSKPVRIIVQTAAGSSIDVTARILAEHLSKRWGQQVVILNQPGAGGAVAARALASSPPDGYTLFFAASSVFVVLPELQKNLAGEVKSFVPVAFIGETPMAIAVSAKTPANSLAELIALAKQSKDGLNCAASTRGGLSHLSAESLKDAAKIDMTFIHYPGTAQALTDVIADRVPMVVDSISAILGPAKGGQLKLLAIGAPSRLKSLPDVPAAAETLPNFEATAWFAIVAPQGTPSDIVGKIGTDVNAVLQEPAVRSRLEELGTFVRSMPANELEAFIAQQKAKWAPIVQRVAN
jgi:tripartite-type tricarboxylate transporter receptor subunit TctC